MSKQRCEYCKWEGEYPTEVHIEKRGTDSVLACVDEDACNARWFEQHPDE